jgi:hypothetical protein
MSLVEWELRERRRVRPSGAEREGTGLGEPRRRGECEAKGS